jgi:hypothetical protein
METAALILEGRALRTRDLRGASLLFIKVDMSQIPEWEKSRRFSSMVWELVKRAEGPEYEQARFQGQGLALISEPPGFIAQIDWSTCSVCGQEDLTVKGVCYRCKDSRLSSL